ncbi:MAG: isochorismate synthase [Microcoleus sp. PH2017_10_PVI_O_A]|nr:MULTISPECIES: isochorismate synthase [unclassified Microcoleus]TAE80851.1 MAG: isochorismate synthase [Oscillatoriales cyanobacterium]MCC3407396.1 isochorismate synthase [Microcoleus sp. PH2017_10_PVI_O_A]MCC3461455.1 isochorismate synthase [Microcoleus sp. PH2017_11_PCY_U_A]MCC3479929.1 isochorismate synthase [Microcoleus sp. PH2017_12_PCY_D_A]MCC3560573.1 isochorismate synthase [Microcoleus sp. PH2017_27_LUM_O_A]
MNLSKSVVGAMRYVSEAASRIFRRSDDDYPATGVQPFERKPPKGSKWER